MARKDLILNRYEPIGKAGTGGFSTVVAAFDTHLKRNVAIKAIDLDDFTAQQLAWSMGIAEEPPTVDQRAQDRATRRALSPAAKAEAKRNFTLPWEEEPVEIDAFGNVVETHLLDELDEIVEFDEPDSESNNEPNINEPNNGPNNKEAQPDDFSATDPSATGFSVADFLADADFDYPEDPAFLDGETFDFSREGLEGLPDATHSRLFSREQQASTSHLPGLSEAQVAGNLGSPNIVSVYDLQLEGNTAYLIMEYVDGMTLAEFLETYDDDMTLNIVAAVADGVSNALETAHRNNVLHLDIKPGNILIDQQGNIKVTDFGMAALPDSEGKRHGDGGTIGYMPPEQIDRETLDERCDEWALASVLYEMLAGENPFRTDNLNTARNAITNAELVLPSLMWEQLDEQADDVLFYALDPDREERYETVEDFAEEFVPLLGKPRKGRQELAALLTASEEVEEDEEASWEPHVPQIPLKERLTPRAASIAGRTFAFIATALVMALSMVNMPQGNATFALIAWAVVAVGSVAAAFLPCVGPLFAFAALGASLIWNGHYIPAAVLIVVTAGWWIFNAKSRNAKAAPNIATGTVLAGAIGFGPLAPLASGYFLTVGKAAMTSTLSFVIAFTLASLGSRNLIGWNSLDYALFSTSAISVTDVYIRLLVQPSILLMGLSWILAAVILSLCCSVGKRWAAIGGAVVSGIILMAGAVAFQFFSTNGINPMPTAWQIASILICTLVTIGCAYTIIPAAPENTT